jgi:rhodanese-related sulfurtransferase
MTLTEQVIDSNFVLKSSLEIREDLLAGREIALLDVREEALHAEGHPLFAANLPLSRIEQEAYARIPRLTVPIVVFDDGEGLALKAADRLRALGYEDVHLLENGLQGWRDAGYEVFRDVNAPSKAFGELVESKRHTPSLSAQEVKALLDARADIVIVDVRRFDEFHTMSIPTATSVPGGELALRMRELAPDPGTRIIVNCAGRTRGLIGTQSLINAGIPNEVAALRNGTIGWTLAHQELEHGQTRRFPEVSEEIRDTAAVSARELANKAGVLRTSQAAVAAWIKKGDVTVYRFDVRSPEEFEQGRLDGYRNAPGGQLVQETDMFAPVRNARIVLADDDGVRANMTSSWLAQMGWEVYVVDGLSASDFADTSAWQEPLPPPPELSESVVVSALLLNEWLNSGDEITVLDLARGADYAKRHIPGSWFASRSQLEETMRSVAGAKKIVLTSPDGIAARFAWHEMTEMSAASVFVLDGGTRRWIDSGLSATDLDAKYACRPTDRYRRPYEGTNIDPAAMQAYLDWEYGLVRQLELDGTHGFKVF